MELPRFWIVVQVLIVIFVLIGMVIAIIEARLSRAARSRLDLGARASISSISLTQNSSTHDHDQRQDRHGHEQADEAEQLADHHHADGDHRRVHARALDITIGIVTLLSICWTST